MLYTTNVTKKGQITLPKKLRDSLNIGVYEKVTVIINNNHLEIYPTSDILDLAGKFKTKKKGSVPDARNMLENRYLSPTRR